MPNENNEHSIQHIGSTILVVMMEVDPEGEEAFERWYNEEHLPERLEIPGYVSARRFKLEEGNGVLKYLCIWSWRTAARCRAISIMPNGPAQAKFETGPTST